MKLFLALFLPVSFFLVFVLRTLLVWRRTGINPVAFKGSKDVHSYIGGIFVLLEVVVVTSIVLFVVGRHEWLGAISPLEQLPIALAGAALLVLSTLWAAIAQAQMGVSWRIGIDEYNETDLVTGGLFRWSRNPIFLAMQVSLIGLFLALPTVATLVVLLVGHVVLSIQVRLEESFLSKQHGERYDSYRRMVRRWL